MEDTSGKSKFLKSINQKIRTLFSKALSREVRIFLVFLLISAFFWILQSLQEVREFNLDVPISYGTIPPHVSITGALPASVSVTLRDKGTNLYYYYRHRKDLKVSIRLMDYYRKDDIGRIPSSSYESSLRNKLMPSTQLLRIQPDTISVYFAEKTVRKVPVRLHTDFTLESQHMLADTPLVTPSFVSVYAPAALLKKIQYVETELLELKGLKDSMQVTVKLKPIQGINMSVQAVDVNINVEEFTEMSVSVPVQGFHFPEGQHLLSFPPEVQVTFFVGLSRFKQVKGSDFKLAVDYEQLIKSDQNTQKVRMISRPDFVHNVRLRPESVECLIEK